MGKSLSARSRRGQVLALSPIFILGLLAALALAVDVGSIAVEKARMQNAADAAALAATRVLSDRRVAGDSESACRDAATQSADALLQANAPSARIVLQFGEEPLGGTFSEESDTEQATAVRAVVVRDAQAPGGSFPLLFASVLGVSGTSVKAQATAAMSSSITGVYEGLRPFAVPKDRLPGIGGTMNFYPSDSDDYNQGLGSDTVAPGCWGLLNLDGGDLSSSEINNWIYNGYNGGIELDSVTDCVWVDGTTGFRATMNNPLQDVIGDTFIMCVYDQVVGNGSNGSFRIVGFVLATITGARLVGNNPYIQCKISAVKTLHGVKVGPGDDTLNINKIELVD